MLHILLVEDDSGVRNATCVFLKAEGCKVLAAASLSEAERFAAERPDIEILISDYHVGSGQTGADVIAAVRSKLGHSIKTIFVTGDPDAVAFSLQKDPDVRITSKPINTDVLLGLIRELAPHAFP